MTRAALFAKHAGLCDHIARDFRIPGLELDDWRQEARVALWIATGSFDPAHGVRFKTFAAMCIRRRLIDVLEMALRGRHAILTNAVRVTTLEHGGELEEVTIVDVLAGGHDPAEVVVTRELLDRIIAALDGLTARERECLALTTAGTVSEKAVHNNARSARRKLRAALAA